MFWNYLEFDWGSRNSSYLIVCFRGKDFKGIIKLRKKLIKIKDIILSLKDLFENIMKHGYKLEDKV